MANFGGFSWRRLLGISAFKSRVSRTIGIPLTASGRRRKLGASIFNAVGPVAGTLAVAAVGVAARASKASGTGIASEAVKKLAHKAQAEARKTQKKEGWQSTFIYFENAEQHQVVLATDTEQVLETIQAGLAQVGFIGSNDAPKGIKFGFALLDESLPPDGVVAKRFLANGHDWVTAWTKYLCAQWGVAAPIEHDFVPSSPLVSKPSSSANANPFGLPFPKNPDNPFPIGTARPGPSAMKVVGSLALMFVLISLVAFAIQQLSTAPTPIPATVSTVNGVSIDNEADMLVSRCGPPSKDKSSEYAQPRPLVPTRIIEYRKSRLRFMFKLLGVRQIWQLVGITDMSRGHSKARVVLPKEAVSRMSCWGGAI